jgi:hypothetical protein
VCVCVCVWCVCVCVCVSVLLLIFNNKAYTCIYKTGRATVGVELHTHTYVICYVHTRACTYAYIRIHDVPLKKDHVPLHAPLEAQTISGGGGESCFSGVKK